MNLPGAEQGEALNYLVDVSIPTIVFTGTLHDAARDKLLSNQIVDYIIKDSVFAVDMLAEAVGQSAAAIAGTPDSAGCTARAAGCSASNRDRGRRRPARVEAVLEVGRG